MKIGDFSQLGQVSVGTLHHYDELYDSLLRRRVEPGTPEFALYHTVEYLERDIDMEAAVDVDGIPGLSTDGQADRLVFHELPAVPEVASVVHEGGAWEIPQAITALFNWIGANGYATAGPYRGLHLYGRENDLFRADSANANSLLVEIQVPVRAA